MIQHNLLAASKLYLNIGFAALGGLLGITALEAEQTASKMIAEERLTGEKTVVFSSQKKIYQHVLFCRSYRSDRQDHLLSDRCVLADLVGPAHSDCVRRGQRNHRAACAQVSAIRLKNCNSRMKRDMIHFKRTILARSFFFF